MTTAITTLMILAILLGLGYLGVFAYFFLAEVTRYERRAHRD